MNAIERMSGANEDRRTPSRILLAGEAMALFASTHTGDLIHQNQYEESVAGAELNVAIGLKRLGQDPLFVTRVGHDVFGQRILTLLTHNNMSTAGVFVDDTALTGFMLKSRVDAGDPATAYFRSNSAASRLSPDDLGRIDFAQVKAIHLTGVLAALSDSSRWLAQALAAKAVSTRSPSSGKRIFLSVDPNLRPSLWPDKNLMRKTILGLCSKADLVLPGQSEARTLVGTDDPQEAAQRFQEKGARTVVIKCGPRGAFALDAHGSGTWVPGYRVARVLDTVGAGDGFAAGVLSALAEKKTLLQAVTRGCAIGAIQTQSYSDNSGLPTPSQLADFMNTHERSTRTERKTHV